MPGVAEDPSGAAHGSVTPLVAPAPAAGDLDSAPHVAVVGGGISGVAAARALHDRGIEVVVLDRGHRLGGRMAVRTLRSTGTPSDGHVVDVGASYLTARGREFRTVVDNWVDRSLLRPWTDTFVTSSPDGRVGVTTGPLRYAAPRGLRSLVEDLAADLPVVVHPNPVEEVVRVDGGMLVDGALFDAVVLAMPGPQALDIVSDDDPAVPILDALVYDPVLALLAVYEERCWEDFDAMFVNDSALLGFVADDGSRRGDAAAVLVAHSTSLFAALHLDDPLAAAPQLLEVLRPVVGTAGEPAWFDVRRWSLAKPRRSEGVDHWFDGSLGLCGDVWGEVPKIETAWTSGRSLGAAIADHLLS
jgi:renalase